MQARRFIFSVLGVVLTGLIFSGCLKNPDQGDPGLTFFNADGEKAQSTGNAPESATEAAERFADPVKSEEASQSDLTMIRQALAENFKLAVEEVEATIERDSNENFATGYVNVGEGERGGVYFAAKTANGWEIAYNGTGTLTCSLIEGYDFPSGMIPKCYDTTTGLMVER